MLVRFPTVFLEKRNCKNDIKIDSGKPPITLVPVITKVCKETLLFGLKPGEL